MPQFESVFLDTSGECGIVIDSICYMFALLGTGADKVPLAKAPALLDEPLMEGAVR